MNKTLDPGPAQQSPTASKPAHRVAAACLVLALCLSGCATSAREEAQAWLLAGEYEKAMASVQLGLQRTPNDALLRAIQLRLEEDIAGRITQQMVQLRTAGQYEQALQVLERARKLRLKSLPHKEWQANLEAEQRAQGLLQASTQAAQAGELDKALDLARRGLAGAPQNRGLQLLERRLSSQWRLQSGTAALPQMQEGTPVTLELRQAPLAAALDILARGSGINFVLDRDVRQDAPLTVFMRNARLADALDMVLSAQGLTRRVVNDKTVLIFANTPEKKKEHQEVVVRVFHLTHTEAKTAANMLRSTLRTAEPFVDERANTVTLRESADVVALAERLMALHDTPDPEVMLEVEVLEVSRSRLQNLGINVPSSLTLTPLNANKASSGLTVDDFRNIGAARVGVSVSPLTLNLRRELGEGQVLANPSIRTKNREKAKILIGDKVPVVTTSSTATGIVGQNISYLEVGLKLEVEPLISPDEDITLKLALEVSNITKQIETGNGGTAYQIGTRNAGTTLRLQDGETQLLGGLISKTDSSASARIPGLGDLPVLGRLFGNQQDNSAQSELVLSITPRIVRSAWQPDALQAVVRMGTENTPRLQQLKLASLATGSAAGDMATPPSAEKEESPVVKATWKSSPPAMAGKLIIVQIDLTGPQQLQGVPLEIAYPPQALEVMSVRTVGMAQQDQSVQLSYAVNSQDGKLSVHLQSLRQAAGVSANFGLQLLLKPKMVGEHVLRLTHLAPMGAQGPLKLEGDLPSLMLKVQAP